ncbi:MAG: CapA family protein [Clostridia bacterium]|nr:CapA family protein [Clostridia bacterium]
MKKRNKKLNKKRIITLIVLILLIVIFFYLLIQAKSKNIESSNDNAIPTSADNSKETEKPIPQDTTINMSVIGDIMCHDTQYKDAYNSSTKEYDFSYVFSDVEYYLQTADITVGNLETTFAGKEVGYSNYPTFNTPEALAYNLKKLGIDVLSTANNHSMDKGYKGLVSTLNFLDDAGITHTGTYASEEAQNEILIQNVKGIKIAFLSFTYGTNGIRIPSGKEYCINLIDKNLIKKQIELAQEKQPDLICVFMHWGDEYHIKQNSTQEDLADFLFENGVDVILGGHPHVLEPMEKRTLTLPDGSTKDGFLIYSLGNFVSGQKDEDTKTSAILNLTFTKNGETGKMSIDSAKYTPVYMYKSASSQTQRFKLLVTEKSIADYESGTNTSIGITTYNNLKNALKSTRKILGEEIN